jgi:hypothetical protein
LSMLRKLDLEEIPGLKDAELLRWPSNVTVASNWDRPTLPRDLVPNGIRDHAA